MSRLRIHPGEVLSEEYLKPLGLSARALGNSIGVPGNRISDIARGRRDVSADTGIRLGRVFGKNPRFWLNLQDGYNLSKAESAHDYSSLKSLPGAKSLPHKGIALGRVG